MLCVVGLTLSILVGAARFPAGAGSCFQQVYGAQASASSCGKLGWSYDPATRSFEFGSKITASDDPQGSRYVYRLVAACDQNTSGAQVSGSCANFANCAPRVGPDGDPLRAARFQGMRAPKGPDGRQRGELATYGEAICVYSGKSVPMAAVVAAVRDQLVKRVGRPSIAVQPATRGLIRFPVLFSAPAQPVTALQISRPLRGAITATPGYAWDLGAGQSGTGPGHRYTEAVDPRSPPGQGYYVQAVYEVPGRHRVQLTLTWQVGLHLGPAGGGLDVALDPITFTATATATVVSATNRLYSQTPD
jgi:hypothetical protein